MLGSIEVSAEYVRLWNLMSRCRSCRKFRQLAVRGVEVQIVVRGKKVVIRKRKVGTAMPCIENCEKMTAEEKAMYDVLRLQELKEVYEPIEVDYSEDNAREDALVVVDDKTRWMRIELNSFI